MVGKRESMKTGCNWLQDTNCMNGRPLIITKLGFEAFPTLGAQFGERNDDRVDQQSADEFRNSFLKKRLAPLFYPFALLPAEIIVE